MKTLTTLDNGLRSMNFRLSEHCPEYAENDHMYAVGSRYRDVAAIVLVYDTTQPFAQSAKVFSLLLLCSCANLFPLIVRR